MVLQNVLPLKTGHLRKKILNLFLTQDLCPHVRCNLLCPVPYLMPR